MCEPPCTQSDTYFSEQAERRLEEMIMGFVAVLLHLLFFVTSSVFSTRTNLEKKLAQTTTKYEEEKTSVKKHHSTIAKVWFCWCCLTRKEDSRLLPQFFTLDVCGTPFFSGFFPFSPYNKMWKHRKRW